MICFIILHYQAIDETINCLESIRSFVKEEKKIIIVDNASPNNSGKFLYDNYSHEEDILILLQTENLGFARGNNVGYSEAKKYNPQYIVVLNSDTLLTQDNFMELLDKAYNEYNFDVLGPDIYSTKLNIHQNPQRQDNYKLSDLKRIRNKLIIKNIFKKLLRIKYFFVKTPNESSNDNTQFSEVQIGKVLHGSFYIFSLNFIEKYDKCFYDKTFMYFESAILHYIGMKENMVFLYYPYIKVIHHEDASTDMTFNEQYKKSCFVNKWMLDSCKKYIGIVENDRKELNQ